MSLKLGITGGIASGKSVVSHLVNQLDIPVYNSDIEAKRLILLHPKIKEGLIRVLGNDIYHNGLLNKEKLAAYLFANADNANRINAIVHPIVMEDFKQWLKKYEYKPIVAIESAILIESSFVDLVDKVLIVQAPLGLRIERIQQRDQLNEADALKRINSQMSDEQRLEYADYLIMNDGENPLIPQVLKLISSLSQIIA